MAKTTRRAPTATVTRRQSAPAAPAPAAQPTPRKRIGRAKHPDYQQVSVYLPKSLHHRLRIAAAEQDRELTDCIEEGLAQWVEAWAKVRPRHGF
ncbi:hypothetical protein [Luteitalea sp.]